MTTCSPGGMRRIDLSADRLSARRARHFVRSALADWGCEQLEGDATLAVSELVTNAVVHAKCGPSVTLLNRDLDVQIRVRDSEPRPPIIESDPAHETGRGMTIVDAVAERWGLEPSPPGKIIWLDICKSPRTPAPLAIRDRRRKRMRR